MPRTRKRKSAPAEPSEVQEVEEEHEVQQAQNGVEDMEVEQSELRSLQFHEPLTWRAGQPIPVSELLRRLKLLSGELNDIDQGELARDTLSSVAQDLASAQLLGHKDKGVKAWTLRCIARVFHLLAPNAPYKSSQLRNIFTPFVSHIIPALASSTDPYHEQHLEILTSFTADESIALINDFPGSDDLVTRLFSECFDVLTGDAKHAGGENISKNVEYKMTTMLVAVIDASDSIPQGVVDVLLAQFLRADPTLLGSHGQNVILSMLDPPPAYSMARSICNSCSSKVARSVSQYFSSVLIDASEVLSPAKPKLPRGKKRTHDESEDESDDQHYNARAEDGSEGAKQVHRLLRELWRSSPDVIQGVIPQIEAEVSAENTLLRTMAVQTIGDMIAGIGAAGPPESVALNPVAWPSQSLNMDAARAKAQGFLLKPASPFAFSSIYPACYQAFVDRRRDKAATVRAAWTTAVARVLSTIAGGKGLSEEHEGNLLRYFADMLKDNDEKVRLAAIEAIHAFDFPGLVEHLAKTGGIAKPDSIFYNLAERIKDTRPHVRAEAIKLLGNIWGVAAGAIANGDEELRSIFGPIPSRILEARYINKADINFHVLSALHESLLPTNYPPIKSKQPDDGNAQNGTDKADDPDAIRAERILLLTRDLEERAGTVFFGLQKIQPQKAKYLNSYLEHCEKLGRDKADKEAKQKLDKLIEILAKDFPDADTARDQLKLFAKRNDRRSYQLLRFCYAPESDYRKVIKAIKELTKRLQDTATPVPSVLATLIPLLNSAALLIYNRSHVPAIMQFASTDEKGLSATANRVIKDIASTVPDVFKIHVHELCETLKKLVPDSSGQTDSSAIDTLKACASFARQFPHEMPKDRAFYQAMSAFALNGKPAATSKYAVTVIATSADKKEMYVENLLTECINDFDYGSQSFLSRLAALAQMRLLANEQSEKDADAITTIAVGKILSPIRTPADDANPDWSPTNNLDDDISAKLLALKILVNGLRGRQTLNDSAEDKSALRAAADPVYKLLNTLIDRDGQMSKIASTAKHHRAHLRLAAGLSLLKLSCDRTLDMFLSHADFNRLAKLCQDPLPEVRAGFVKRLKKYLGQNRLPSRFFALIFIYAFEPSKEVKQSTETWIRARAAMSGRKDDKSEGVLEAVFARFLSLLAHHQDYSDQAEDLKDIVEYIVFYLKNVASEANLPHIYHLAQRIKTVQDGIDESKSKDLYMVSDLAEVVIRAYQDEKGWSLQMFPGKVRLPAGLFQALPSHISAQALAEERFLPDDIAEDIPGLVRASLKPKKRKAERASERPAKKARASADAVSKPERKRPSSTAARKGAKSAKKAERQWSEQASDAADNAERRRSTRHAAASTSYVEEESEADDEELERWNDGADADEDKENHKQAEDTPPTSEPLDEDLEAEEAEVVKEAKPAESMPSKRGRAQSGKGKGKVSKKAAAPPARRKPPTRGGKTRAVGKDVFDLPDDSE